MTSTKLTSAAAEGNWVHSNTYINNGYDADPFVRDLGIPTADILWDGTGMDNRFNEESATSFPPLIPGDGWPSFARRGYTNILGFLVDQLSNPVGADFDAPPKWLARQNPRFRGQKAPPQEQGQDRLHCCRRSGNLPVFSGALPHPPAKQQRRHHFR
ncbi:MAG: hypothetical protein H6657_01905 [Ardenticatenaceae bacterium]|nr:hypothetical protein [Ardenticatenaceae bacterium]